MTSSKRFPIVGHTNQRHSLANIASAGKLPSALLFAGAGGIGKFLVARELSKTLFCKRFTTAKSPEEAASLYGGCGSCHECALFESGNLPDFHVVDCSDKEQWAIASI